MGCWNGTCAVSNLAITYGDPCRLIIIEEKPYGYSGGGFCYSTDAWYPRVMPIKGIYDDYGSIERFELNDFHEISFEQFKEDWVDPPPNEVHAKEEMYLDKLSWEGIIGAIERGLAMVTYRGVVPPPDTGEIQSPSEEVVERELRRLENDTRFDGDGLTEKQKKKFARLQAWNFELQHKNGDLRGYVSGLQNKRPHQYGRLGFIMVLEDVWQAMVQCQGNLKDWRDKQSFREVFRADLEKGLEGTKHIAALEEQPDTDQKDVWSERFRLRHDILEMSTLRSFSITGEANIRIDPILERLAKKEDARPLIEELIDFMCFNSAMSSLRKAYYPSAGKGSQDDHHAGHLALAKVVPEIIKKRKREYEEDE